MRLRLNYVIIIAYCQEINFIFLWGEGEINLSTVEHGKIGEHICMIRLLKMGISCEIVHIDTVDIVAYIDGSMVRVQVKTSTIKQNRKRGLNGGAPGYQFATSYSGKKKPLTEEHCDIVAFVALEAERVLFMPIGCLKNQVTKRMPPSKFEKEGLEERSWQHCLDAIFLSN